MSDIYHDTVLAAAALHHAGDRRTPEQRQADMVVRGLLHPCEVTDPAVDTGRHHRKVGDEVYIERFTPPGRHRSLLCPHCPRPAHDGACS